MARLRRYAPALLAGTLALLAGAWLGWSRIAPDTGNNAEAFWATAMTDLAGHPVDLGKFRGRPLVVNFWATWCGPCKEEMPDFQRLATSDLGKNLLIVGIGIDNADNMREFSEKLGISYTLLAGGAQAMDLMKAMGNRVGGLPYTVVLDARGNISTKHLGRMSAAQLDSAARQAVSR